MKSILMSIKKPIADTIFREWTKRLEYRTRFNREYKGRVYVYESGKDGGKVVGFFDVQRIFRARYDKAPTPEDWKIIEALDERNFDEFFRIKAHATPSVYALEITNPCIFSRPKDLREFRGLKGETVKTAPQSWQYIDATGLKYTYTQVPPSAAHVEGPSPTEQFMNER